MEILKKLTLINSTPRNNAARIKYIVAHYTGNEDDTAENNAKYFYEEYRGASAHYFVDENTIYQVVEDGDIAWHCGANVYRHPDCRNSNSIGVEMCNFVSANPQVQANAVGLIKELMTKYDIPVDRVLRHFDVTGKLCPAPLVDNLAWERFKSELTKVELRIDQKYTIEDATQDLFWKKLLTDRIFWNDKAYMDIDLSWLLLKYYDYVLINKGSIKEGEISVKDSVDILTKQSIIADSKLWLSKAKKDEDIKSLIQKMANYIN